MTRTLTYIIGAILLWAAVSHADWSTPVRISEPGGCMYPQILAQGDTLHVVFSHWVRGRGLGYVRSTDAGLTWSQEIELSDTVNTNAPLYPRIMAWRQNLLVLWYIYFNNDSNENIGYSISHNNGLSWSSPDYILTSNWDLLGFMTAANNDSVVNVILTSSDTLFYNARSTDFGATWASPQAIFGVAHCNKPDQASRGQLVHFTWAGHFSDNDNWEAYYIKSTDWGLTWSDNLLISTMDNHPSQFPAITANETANPAVSWWDFKYSPYQTSGDILARWSHDQGVTWGSESQVTQNHLADASDICWVKDTIRIVWVDWRFGGNSTAIYYTFKADTSQNWAPEERLDYNDTNWSADPSITVSDDNIYAVWYNRRYGSDTSGVYFTRNPAFPDAIDEPDIPDKAGELGAYPNPFNSSVTIGYSNINKGGELEILNIQGQLVRTFNLTGKEGKIIWDATDASGNKVSSGIYFAKVGASQKTYTVKLSYLR